MKLAAPDVTVVENVPTEVLADAIVAISAAAKKMESSGLNRQALLTLLKGSTGVPMKTINAVLDGLGNLAKQQYTTKK